MKRMITDYKVLYKKDDNGKIYYVSDYENAELNGKKCIGALKFSVNSLNAKPVPTNIKMRNVIGPKNLRSATFHSRSFIKI